jgi:hypothetical protein
MRRRFGIGSAVAVAGTFVVMGCSPVKTDFDNLCHAQERSGSTGTMPEDHANAMRWADRALKTQEVRGLVGRLENMSAYDKGTLLRAEVAKAGVSPCPLADAWASPR